MPGRDGTGPIGKGPMTGGGFGNCGIGLRENDVRGIGRGGFPFGGGRGRCFGGGSRMGRRGAFSSQETHSLDEKHILEKRAASLENELAAVRERLSSFE